MKVLFDSNLWISFMIGKRLSSLADVLCHHDIEVYISEQQLDEIRKVIAREKFDKLISSETRYYFFEMIYDVCLFTDITVEAESNIRDPKDLYLLSMAESVPVDFIACLVGKTCRCNPHVFQNRDPFCPVSPSQHASMTAKAANFPITPIADMALLLCNALS